MGRILQASICLLGFVGAEEGKTDFTFNSSCDIDMSWEKMVAKKSSLSNIDCVPEAYIDYLENWPAAYECLSAESFSEPQVCKTTVKEFQKSVSNLLKVINFNFEEAYNKDAQTTTDADIETDIQKTERNFA